jgi:hypothetical protein
LVFGVQSRASRTRSTAGLAGLGGRDAVADGDADAEGAKAEADAPADGDAGAADVGATEGDATVAVGAVEADGLALGAGALEDADEGAGGAETNDPVVDPVHAASTAVSTHPTTNNPARPRGRRSGSVPVTFDSLHVRWHENAVPGYTERRRSSSGLLPSLV